MKASRAPGSRAAWLLAGLALLGAVAAGQRTGSPARAIAPPAAYAVAQSPLTASVAPGDAVSYTVNFATGATAASFLFLEGNLGASLTIQSFSGGLGPSVCSASGANNQLFSCNLGSLGASTAIDSITVHAVVRNVADATVIDLLPAAFKAKDGAADPGVSPASDDAGALTVQNENVQVTVTASLPELFEAGLVNIAVGLANTGSGATGSFSAGLAISGGTVTNVVCPGGSPGTGSGTASAACSAVSLGASPTPPGTMTVTVKAADNAGQGTLAASASLSAGIFGAIGSMAPLTVHELTLTGPATAATGAIVTICTTNAPSNAALLAGYPSTLNPLATGDYVLTPAAGASVSGLTSATTCGAGQQGVSFNSPTAGTVSVVARSSAPGSGAAVIGQSNARTITFGGGSTATQLAFTAYPPSAVTGVAFTTVPVVAVRDSGGTLVAADSSTQVTLSLASAPSGAVLTCTGGATRTAAAGLATFSGCSVSTAGSGYILRATATGLTQADAPAFTATAHGPAAKLAFLAQPAGAAPGEPLGAQPVVAVQDTAGATVTSDSSTSVTLAISGSATLTCTGGLSKIVTAGVATFSGCSATPAGEAYTITATSSPVLTPATSTAFSIAEAEPTSSTQLVVEAPAAGQSVPRSRLTFTAADGSLAPGSVAFIIKRVSDNKYWNSATGQWQSEVYLNAATSVDGAWELPIQGAARRQFAGITVTVEARATVGSTTYVSATIPSIPVR